MKGLIVIVAMTIALLFFFAGCSTNSENSIFDNGKNNDSSEVGDVEENGTTNSSYEFDRPDENNIGDPYYSVMDIHWYGDGTIAALYENLNFIENGYGSMLIRINLDGEILWEAGSDFSFPHTLFPMGDGFLVSDSDNQRIVQINQDHQIVWELGTTEMGEYFWPNEADITEDGTVLLNDHWSSIIYEVDFLGKVLWSFDTHKHNSGNELEIHDPDKLENGNILYCDSSNNKVIEIDRHENLVWSYEGDLVWPRNADRLPNGNTLITDNEKCIEITPEGEIVWSFEGLNGAFNAERNNDGNTLIAAGGDRIILVDQEGEVIWSFSLMGEKQKASANARAFMKPHRKYVLQTLGYIQ